jgi:hypothetical protein
MMSFLSFSDGFRFHAWHRRAGLRALLLVGLDLHGAQVHAQPKPD